MKAVKFFAISAMAAAMITSCSSEDELSQSNYPSDNIIRVTAGVNNAKTRAEGAGTEMKNDFSLTIVNKNTEKPELASKYSYTDKVFSKKSGDWACSETLLWQNATTPVDILAFAPAQEEIFRDAYNANEGFKSVAYRIAADQSIKSDNNDLLYNYTPGFVPKDKLENQKLNIQFNHAFSMIDINVTLGTEFNKPDILEKSPITEVTLEGTKIEANVNVTNAANIVTASEEATAAKITTTNGSFDKAANAEANAISRFSCIAIPQMVAANTFKVSLKTANKLYEWTYDKAVELKSGYRYTLNLTMGDNVVLLKGGSITATPWGNGEGGSLETD